MSLYFFSMHDNVTAIQRQLYLKNSLFGKPAKDNEQKLGELWIVYGITNTGRASLQLLETLKE